MFEFITHRDAEASLWQSAVEEVLARRAAGLPPEVSEQEPPAAPASAGSPNRVRRLAALAGTVIGGMKAVAGSVALRETTEDLDALDAAVPADESQIGAFVAGLARRLGDDEGRFRAVLRFRRFSRLDPLWAEAAIYYYRSLRGKRDRVPYRRHQHPADFVLDDVLPDRGRVALVADWGTGTAEAREVLREVAARAPDVVIHLGDIYYSGTRTEVRRRFLDPVRETPGLGRTRVFTLSGNHDMYSGGHGYYELLDELGQPASYFCLRNQHWQLVAMDTGLHSGLTDKEVATDLEPAEADWLKEKVQSAGRRRTILLSHHPLFSAHEGIGEGGDGVNEKLLGQLAPVLPEVAAWFWGHEHNLILYGEFLGVRKARCIGHGAVPVSDLLRPGSPRFPEVPFDDGIRLGLTDGFFHHGYAVLEFDGPAARAAYFQAPDGDRAHFEEVL